MYQPIAFPVIFQALHWHGFPQPRLRQLSFCDDFEDAVVAEYVAAWSADKLRAHYGLDGYPENRLHTEYIRQSIQDCFCEDVTVQDVMYSPFKDEFHALLYIKVSRSMEAWTQWLDQNPR